MLEITTLKRGAFTVDIRSDSDHFTVWNGDLPVGTIRRPRRGKVSWAAYDTDGELIRYAVGPRIAFSAIVAEAQGVRKPGRVQREW